MTRVRVQIWVVLAAALAAIVAGAMHRWAAAVPVRTEWAPHPPAISAQWPAYLPPDRLHLVFRAPSQPGLRTIAVSGMAGARPVAVRAAFRTAPLPSRAPPTVPV